MVDVSDPETPRVSERLEIESKPKCVRFCEGKMVVTTDKGVLIFGIGVEGELERTLLIMDLSSPGIISSLELERGFERIALAEDRVVLF